MRQGKNIAELVAEIDRQANSRRDFIAGARGISIDESNRLAFGSTAVGIKPIAHQQISEFIDVPREFYDRIRGTHPALYAHTVNTLMKAKPETDRRMIRTMDGDARAFLSDRYRPIDNIDLIGQLLPVLMARKDLRFASAEVTDRRLYIKIVSDELTGEVKRGDVVRAGLLISNSEVGFGAVTVAPFSDRLICTNGMIHTNFGERRNHIGGRADDLGEIDFTDETKQAADRAFFLKVRDSINAMLNGDTLDRILDQMRAAEGEKIEGDPSAVVEVMARNSGLNEGERTSVLRHLIEGADLSKWGLANAVTRTAQDAETYDRATDLESLGGVLLASPLPDVTRVAVKRRGRREVAAV